ncbi:membrane lipoprotein lipid attachment site-containing protein [Nitrogeniibacter aestuarii]|uniref:membrane lipoprotein lipid attachment site-containing protein n=1 Tax=Nitrogeniibacter aestuarii TaxID=2815343 RepID=UPI001D127278|nr:membrane lipoprotein lipid attachment site-containing protein [Nitrogeniibacter aestuarii]
MKKLLIAIGMAALLSACQTTGDFSGSLEARRSAVDEAGAPCVRVHAAGDYRLVENACPGADARRITLIDQAGERYYASYDPTFTRWAWTEGCATEGACAYTLKVREGAITAFTYRFAINLSEGEIDVEVAGDTLVVVRRQIVDQPS